MADAIERTSRLKCALVVVALAVLSGVLLRSRLDGDDEEEFEAFLAQQSSWPLSSVECVGEMQNEVRNRTCTYSNLYFVAGEFVFAVEEGSVMQDGWVESLTVQLTDRPIPSRGPPPYTFTPRRMTQEDIGAVLGAEEPRHVPGLTVLFDRFYPFAIGHAVW
jgi:hypothetical protein